MSVVVLCVCAVSCDAWYALELVGMVIIEEESRAHTGRWVELSDLGDRHDNTTPRQHLHLRAHFTKMLGTIYTPAPRPTSLLLPA